MFGLDSPGFYTPKMWAPSFVTVDPGTGPIHLWGANAVFARNTSFVLDKDVVCENMFVDENAQVDTNGWRIYCRGKLVLSPGSSLTNNGHDGASPSADGLVPGPGGPGAPSHTVGSSGAGSPGGNPATTHDGPAGEGITSNPFYIGGTGGKGGDGQPAATPPLYIGGAGGIGGGGSYGTLYGAMGASLALQAMLMGPPGVFLARGGGGGGGGASGVDRPNPSAGAGCGAGGGSGGGIIHVIAHEIVLSLDALIQAKGGKGGDFTFTGGTFFVGGAGSGGGGAGGAIILVCNELVTVGTPGLTSPIDVSGGLGGVISPIGGSITPGLNGQGLPGGVGRVFLYSEHGSCVISETGVFLAAARYPRDLTNTTDQSFLHAQDYHF